jgi:hypothetical protein
LSSKILLSGFLRCPCGANLLVISRRRASGPRRFWVCSTAHHRGITRCANSKPIPFEPLTQAVVGTFKENFLNPVAIGKLLALELAERAASPDATKAEATQIRRDLGKLDREIPRLVEALATGTGPIAPLTEALQAREDQRVELRGRLETLEATSRAAEEFDLPAWLEETRELLEETRDLLEASPEAGRQLLRRFLVKPVTVRPDPAGGWIYETEGRFIAAELTKLVAEADIVMSKRDVPTEDRTIQGRIDGPGGGSPVGVPPGGTPAPGPARR